MQVDALMFDPGASIYYDLAFRNVLEDHMTYLRNHESTTHISLSPGSVYRFEFDLFGLLQSYSVPPVLYWVVMRMNNMTSPMDVNPHLEYLMVPDLTTIEHIRQSHMATRRVS